MKNFFPIILVLGILFNFNSCKNQQPNLVDNSFFEGFKNPPSEARPFVRWWWNGNIIKAEELDRELESLKKVGFGGVEINPIAMPAHAQENRDKALVWMSDEWIDLLVHACKKTKDLGMIADMIVGTGWPFGGEFLTDEETTQRVVTHNLPYEGGSLIEVDEMSLLKLFKEANSYTHSPLVGSHQREETTYQLFSLFLVPKDTKQLEQSINLMDFVDEKGRLTYKIEQPGKYNLCYGFLEKNFRKVSLGAPGGDGPVMDHYKKEVTLEYLNRLKKISEKTEISLNELIRALFCDSIEISGANWTDEFDTLFFKTYGYELTPWFPFIFYQPNKGYGKASYEADFDDKFKEELKRVRFDYNNLLVETFLENFTQTFQDFCTENGVLCRYQAYGTPFLMGMLDGYMIPDIPESNNWIYSAEMKDSMWDWSQSHGYMIWNMYAASGGHLKGRKIISCETMTNTSGVFRTTLEEIKQHDDMNFITGMNHAVLHGYNYSPPDVDFPGWVRFGAYFSEQNPWWEHLNSWVDYNARLSYIFQNSQPDKSIAILGPTSDIYGDDGLGRNTFHMTPSYLHKLWEPISQLGYSCDYINQNILQGAEFKEGTIQYGTMKYSLLVLASLKSIHPKTAEFIEKFIQSGGKVIVVDELPIQSLHYKDYDKNDSDVKKVMEQLAKNHPQSLIQIDGPLQAQSLFTWTQQILLKAALKPDVAIDKPSANLYQIHQYTKDKEIYFFTNTHRFNDKSFQAKFPVKDKYPWVWNPETGEKTPYHYNSVNPAELNITLKPLQSLLLVFENEKPETKPISVQTKIKNAVVFNTHWEVEGQQVDGQKLFWKMNNLIDFTKSEDTTQSNFGGKIIYKTFINNTSDFTHIDLGNVNGCTTALFVNGKKVGSRWYGQAIYPVDTFFKAGQNEIEVHYTTILSNYCQSLKNNKVAQSWTRHKAKDPVGLEGPVTLLSYN